jgi:beta-glucosidase
MTSPSRAGALAPQADEALAVRFPPGFLWGASTSAYQIEGSVDVDGRVPSVWDRFAHTPGTIEDGSTGDVACDHYRRWEDDLDLMRWMGLRAYRFSVAWPRVIRDDGSVNAAGLDFYRRLAEGLEERGIVPMLTLFHWDLPVRLHDAGGWPNRDTAERFAEYAEVVAAALGDVVPLWITHNEPWVHAFLGSGTGIHAPGERDWPRAFATAHELLRSHGLAVAAIRSASPTAKVGLAADLYAIEPASDRPEDLEAATRMDGWRNRWILDPLLRGSYPQDTLAAVERDVAPATWMRDGDLATISAPLDFLGVNFYWRQQVEAGGDGDLLAVRQVEPVPPLTAMGWEIVPDRLETVLRRVGRDYPGVPLYVTENGAAFEDEVGADGRVDDPRRVDYLRRHVTAVADAREAGVDVRGYFVWSFLDNFEWARGYVPRFGLTYVDYATQARTPKASAAWYRGLIAASPA